MKLHQIKIEFSAEEDRLLLRVSTDDGKEVLLWLTRRCTRLLWTALMRVIESSPDVALQANNDAKSAVLGFRHEKAIREADFSRPYDDRPRERPLGAKPLLVARIQSRRANRGGCSLSLLPLQGEGLHLTLDEKVLHSLCRLIQGAVAKCSWDLELSLASGQKSRETPELPRTLN